MALTNEECKNTYGNDAPTDIVNSMLCASDIGKDACQVSVKGLLV